ncbi:hypothetical protein EIN_442070 [Entamoeba invadens IP1]|uniref:Uncharacterized protein n=1 Tax=Entamoeba invadens IP1 TaxID=370355 RepID=A0A0A1UB22_ENTIV|nr:hypothetical protein EIN_442070 [Entamoeba invadens IP1]ELP92367.1 hypothetical protein EIN_442070 [Entamoeba invadens IP1]|eukprot:XP_004259138.1 hypothetical protein EIN_442070 [Entamoeba invadens IP1]
MPCLIVLNVNQSNFSIVNYTGNQLILNDERLQYFACQECSNKVVVLHNSKLYNNKFFLDVQKYTNFNVVQIDMPQIVVFEKNTEVLFEAKMGSLAYTPLFISILKLENDVILRNYSYEIFDFKVTNTDVVVLLGHVGNATFSGMTCKKVVMGNVKLINCINCNIEMLEAKKILKTHLQKV